MFFFSLLADKMTKSKFFFRSFFAYWYFLKVHLHQFSYLKSYKEVHRILLRHSNTALITGRVKVNHLKFIFLYRYVQYGTVPSMSVISYFPVLYMNIRQDAGI